MRLSIFICLFVLGSTLTGLVQADVLLLKKNRYIDNVTILRNDAGIIVFIHNGTRYRIPDQLIVKVSDTQPEQGSYVHPDQLVINSVLDDLPDPEFDADSFDHPDDEWNNNDTMAESKQPNESKQKSNLVRRISNRSRPLSDRQLYQKITDRLPTFEGKRPSPERKIGVIYGANVGGGFYMMKAINDVIEDNNSFFNAADVPLQNKIVYDLNYDFMIAINNARISQTGLELSFLDASSNGGNRQFGQNLSIPAFELTVFYKILPIRQGNVRFGFSANVGIIAVTGTLENFYSGFGYSNTSSKVEARGLISKFSTSLEYDLTEHVALNFTAGIRLANLSNAKLINGSRAYDFGADLDYSGVFLKTGLLLF